MTGGSGRPPGQLAAFAALGLAGLWALLAILTWAGLQNGVRVSSPFSTFGYGQSALFSGPVQLLAVGGVVFWNGLAALIGYALVIRPLWGGKGLVSTPWMMFAGVVPGALMIGAVTRLITLAAPNESGAWIVGVLAVIAGVYAARISFGKTPVKERRPVWRWLVVAALALAASLVFQLHIDRGHAVAEGSIWFINEIFLSPTYGLGAGGHFPLLAQHYDEAAFLHPLIFLTVSPGPEAGGTLTLIYWVTLAISRIGMIALTYIALRGLSIDRLSAFACTAFVCMASLSLNPFSSRLLFDSLNPMLYTLHMTRFLAPVLPLIFISALMQGTARWDIKTLGAAFILGVGLAATPVHFVMIAPWAMAVLVLAALTRNSPEPLLRMATWVSALVLVLMSAVYLLQGMPGMLRAGLLVAASVIGGLLMVWAGWRSGLTLPKWQSSEVRSFGVCVVLLAGFGLGLVFLGNVALLKVQPLLGEIWPWSERDAVVRLASHIITPEVSVRASPFCSTGYGWGYRTITGHCGSLPMFVRTYGLPFALIAAVLAWRTLRPEPGVSTRAKAQDGVFVWGLVLCLLALPAAFLAFDFITPDSSDEMHGWSIWLRSRLIEPWFVGGVLLALAFFLRTAGPRERTLAHIALLGAVAIHAFNPLIAPAQWAANVAYWVDAVVR
ncbi:MAG: hypothetical protein ACK4M6_05405 [Hyphomonas sp.]